MGSSFTSNYIIPQKLIIVDTKTIFANNNKTNFV